MAFVALNIFSVLHADSFQADTGLHFITAYGIRYTGTGPCRSIEAAYSYDTRLQALLEHASCPDRILYVVFVDAHAWYISPVGRWPGSW